MSAPQRFRKKPVEIDAMRYDGTGESADAIVAWNERTNAIRSDLGPFTRAVRVRSGMHAPLDERNSLVIDTLEGAMTVDPGDWVIRGVQGEFYPCKPDIFAATYDEVQP